MTHKTAHSEEQVRLGWLWFVTILEWVVFMFGFYLWGDHQVVRGFLELGNNYNLVVYFYMAAFVFPVIGFWSLLGITYLLMRSLQRMKG